MTLLLKGRSLWRTAREARRCSESAGWRGRGVTARCTQCPSQELQAKHRSPSPLLPLTGEKGKTAQTGREKRRHRGGNRRNKPKSRTQLKKNSAKQKRKETTVEESTGKINLMAYHYMGTRREGRHAFNFSTMKRTVWPFRAMQEVRLQGEELPISAIAS